MKVRTRLAEAFAPMKPETLARRAAARSDLDTQRLAQTRATYHKIKDKFHLTGPEPDKVSMTYPLPDGREVIISVDRWSVV